MTLERGTHSTYAAVLLAVTIIGLSLGAIGPAAAQPDFNFSDVEEPPAFNFGEPEEPPAFSFGEPEEPPAFNFGEPEDPPEFNFGEPEEPPEFSFGEPEEPPEFDFGDDEDDEDDGQQTPGDGDDGEEEPTAPANYAVSIDSTNSPVTEGETLTVTASVENTGDEQGTQNVDFSLAGNSDSKSLTLGAGESDTVSFDWQTSSGDAGDYTATVSTDDSSDSTPVSVVTPEPTLESISLSLEETALAVGNETEASVTATYSNETTLDVTGSATLSSSDTTVATVSGSTVTAAAAGSATITAEFDGQTATADVSVEEIPPQLTSIDLSLDQSGLTVGDTATATVTANYDDGSSQDVTGSATLSSGNETVATVSGSTVTAAAAGSATITAEFEDETATAEVSVEEPEPTLESISLSLGETALAVGNETSASVTATYSDGSTADVTSEATLSSGNTAVATVSGSTVTAAAAGSATITAEFEDESATADVSVEALPPQLTSIDLSLAENTLTVGDTTTATVTANYDDGSTADVTGSATLSSGNEMVATVSGSTVTAAAAGSATITAEFEDESATADVSVELPEPTLESVSLTLGSDAVDVGNETTATVTAAYSNGSTLDVTSSATLSSSNTTVATVAGSTVTGAAAGSTTITAEFDGQSGTADLTVNADVPEPDLESIELTVPDTTMTAGDRQQATVTATYTDGSTADVTDQSRFAAQDTTIATVAGPEVIATGEGTTEIGVLYEEDGVQATDRLEITVQRDANVTSLSVSFEQNPVSVGGETNVSVEATYDDDTTSDVTSSATLSSNDTSVATIFDGTVTGEDAGVAAITAEYRGVTATADLTVRPGLESIELSLPDTTMTAGATQQATVTATYSDGSTADVSDQAQFASRDTSIVTTAGSQIIAVSPGESQLGVYYAEGGVQATDQLNVTIIEDRTLEAVDLTLGQTSLAPTNTTTATVTASYDDNSTAAVTSDATLSSSNTSVVTVSGSTLTAQADGSATITADYSDAYGSGSDSVDVTVSSGSDAPSYSSFTVYGSDGYLQLGSNKTDQGGNKKNRFNLTECPGGTPANESLNQSDCITASGSIDADAGTFDVPSENVDFPKLRTYADPLATYINVTITAPNGMSGTIDYESGYMNLEGSLRIRIAPNTFGQNCGFTVPFNATTGTSYNESGNIGSFTGDPLDLDRDSNTANVTQVDATFAVPGASNCGIYENAVEDQVDIPSPSGENVAVLSWYIEFQE